MLFNLRNPLLGSFYLLAALFLLGSCSTQKNTIYFENLNKDTTLTGLITKDFELKIQKGDLLSILMTSKDPTLNVLYNTPGTAGYLVDNSGYIDYFDLGKIKAEGLTRNELKDFLKKKLEPEYLKGVIVTVRFLNHRVTVLGEVGASHVVPMANDQMSILEVLALSGDIGTFGKKENVLVIRENGDDKEFKRINLNDNSVFSSKYYYVRPNDIIYVEPTKAKTKNANQAQTQQIVSYVLSGISVFLIIFTQIFKL